MTDLKELERKALAQLQVWDRAHQDLRELNGILNLMPYYLMVRDVHLNIKFLNEPLARSMGFKHAEEALGRNLRDLEATKEYWQQYADSDADAIAKSPEPVMALEKYTPRGIETWIVVDKVGILDAKGKVEKILAVGRDAGPLLNLFCPACKAGQISLPPHHPGRVVSPGEDVQ